MRTALLLLALAACGDDDDHGHTHAHDDHHDDNDDDGDDDTSAPVDDTSAPEEVRALETDGGTWWVEIAFDSEPAPANARFDIAVSVGMADNPSQHPHGVTLMPSLSHVVSEAGPTASPTVLSDGHGGFVLQNAVLGEEGRWQLTLLLSRVTTQELVTFEFPAGGGGAR